MSLEAVEPTAGTDGAPAPGAPRLPFVATVGAAASALPETVKTTEDVAAHLGVEAEWLVSRTGVRSRRVLAEGETMLDLCEQASSESLRLAGLSPADVDLVLVTTITADQRCPALAPLLAERLGAARAAAIDVGAACTGYLSGLSLAAAQIETGRARTVLLVGSDAIWTRFVDPADRPTAGLFGDGAAATVLRATPAPLREDGTPARPGADAGVGPVLLAADGAGAPHIYAGLETPLHMDGHETFKTAITRISEMSLDACAAAGVSLDEIDLLVPHQANARITAAVGRRLGIDPERVVDCIAHIGNTSGASIPIALAEAARDGRLRDGSLVLLAAFGAGFTYGGAVLRWGLHDS